MWLDCWEDSDRVVFADRRAEETVQHQQSWECRPNVLSDVRQLPFDSGTFDLAAFDPPHRVKEGGMQMLAGVVEKKYGALSVETWQADLSQAVAELRRVLTPAGTLTMKWSDVDKTHGQVLRQIDWTPLYGVTTGQNKADTKWWVFQKHDH